jgi:hypothetical protein
VLERRTKSDCQFFDCFSHSLFTAVFWLHPFASFSGVSQVRLWGFAENGVNVLRVTFNVGVNEFWQVVFHEFPCRRGGILFHESVEETVDQYVALVCREEGAR